MEGMLMRWRGRPAVLVAYATFVLVGIGAGAGGVLLPAQMSGYGVDRATIGITFFAFSAGYVLAGMGNGALIARLGIRLALAVGGAAVVLSGLCLAARPPIAVFMAAQIVLGYAFGVLESALNVYVVALPDSRTLLNRLHAFFGVGALIGPALAAWMLGFTSWPTVMLVLGLAGVPVTICFLAAYPRRPSAAATGPAPDRAPSEGPGPGALASGAMGSGAVGPGALASGAAREEAGAPAVSLLGRALRDPGVLLGTTMLGVYVGVEMGVGDWGFSYLVQARAMPGALAGWSLSGYWAGLTLGRFVISPVAERLRATTAAMIYACLSGVAVAVLGTWLVPGDAAAGAMLLLLGFFLGPVFPTTMAIAARLAPPELGPTAIGVMNAGGVAGGSALPWLAGAIAQAAGIGTLLPFVLVLAVVQLALWRPIARVITTAALARPAGAAPSSAGSR